MFGKLVHVTNLPIRKGSMIAKGNYELSYIELIDCFINQKAIDAFAPNVNYTKTLRDLILDFNEWVQVLCLIIT